MVDPLIALLFLLLIVGVVLALVPVDAKVKLWIYVVLAVIAICCLYREFGHSLSLR